MFYDNSGFDKTILEAELKKHKIDTIFLTGLARDYCVYWTSKDAIKLGRIYKDLRIAFSAYM